MYAVVILYGALIWFYRKFGGIVPVLNGLRELLYEKCSDDSRIVSVNINAIAVIVVTFIFGRFLVENSFSATEKPYDVYLYVLSYGSVGLGVVIGAGARIVR